jgi:hypothetical protein
MRASMDGIITNISQGLYQGDWIGRDSLLMHISSTRGAVLAGLVSERDSGRLNINATGTFVAESGMGAAVEGRLASIGMPNGKGIEFTYLSSSNGGAIAIAPSANNKQEPLSGVLPVRFVVDGLVPKFAIRGTLTAQAEPTSFLAIAFGRVVSVFLRESGF